MRIEAWSVVWSESDPYSPPEMKTQHLSGNVYGHNRFYDGTGITTTAIVAVSGGRVVTRSGSEYELGDPEPEYEAAYPNAKQRLLGTLPVSVNR